ASALLSSRTSTTSRRTWSWSRGSPWRKRGESTARTRVSSAWSEGEPGRYSLHTAGNRSGCAGSDRSTTAPDPRTCVGVSDFQCTARARELWSDEYRRRRSRARNTGNPEQGSGMLTSFARRCRGVIAAAGAVAVAAGASLRLPAERPGAGITEHVIVVSIDGLRPDAIDRYDAGTIRRMMREGAYSLDAQTIFPSKT